MWLCVVVHVRCWDSHFCLHRTLLARRVKGEGVGRWRIWGMWQRVRLLEKYICRNIRKHLPDYMASYLLTYSLTYSMEESPSWEADRISVTQEITLILWNPKVHYCIHKFPSPVPTLSQLDPIHTSTSHFLQIHLNIIFLSTPGSSRWFIYLRFLTKPLYKPLLLPPYLPHAPPISFTALQEYGRLLSLVHRVYAVICVIYWLSVARNGEMVGK